MPFTTAQGSPEYGAMSARLKGGAGICGAGSGRFSAWSDTETVSGLDWEDMADPSPDWEPAACGGRASADSRGLSVEGSGEADTAGDGAS